MTSIDIVERQGKNKRKKRIQILPISSSNNNIKRSNLRKRKQSSGLEIEFDEEVDQPQQYVKKHTNSMSSMEGQIKVLSEEVEDFFDEEEEKQQKIAIQNSKIQRKIE